MPVCVQMTAYCLAHSRTVSPWGHECSLCCMFGSKPAVMLPWLCHGKVRTVVTSPMLRQNGMQQQAVPQLSIASRCVPS
eukprot:4824590-Amphidinium_carterae.1